MGKKFLLTALAAVLTIGALTGCAKTGSESKNSSQVKSASKTESTAGSNSSNTSSKASQTKTSNSKKRVIKLGLTGVIYEDIWNPIKEKLAADGIDLEYVQFSDYKLPNAALNEGEIDINAFQHHAYFNNDTSTNGYKLSAIGDTFIIAMNIYSNKIKSVDELKDGDTIAIPDDASNGGRALKVLEDAGIIELKHETGKNPTVSDIKNYKIKVEIKELGASTIPSVLPDFTAAIINGNYALDYGIDPKTAIFHESKYSDNSYFCLIAVKEGNENDEAYKKIVKLFQSEDTKKIFTDKFGGYFVPAWETKTDGK